MGYDIICISSTRWDFLWQRPQQLMLRLSKNNRVVFLNHSYPVRYYEIKEKLTNPKLWEKRLVEIDKSLWVFSTIQLCKNFSNVMRGDDPDNVSLEAFNYRVKSEILKFVMEKLEFKDPVVITYLPESVNYISEVSPKLICYECIDEWSGFTWSDKNIAEMETQLAQKSDLIFTSAERLYNKMKAINDNTYLLPNAVDFEHFNKAYKYRGGIPEVMHKIRKPIIGFVGAFYDWVDTDLIKFLANSRPEWSFIIIGPVYGVNTKIYKQNANIVFLGIKGYRDLPGYLSCFDVCLIPFKINIVTESANPIKMWEYLATGKPIVSTAIPEVKKFEDIIYIGKDKYDFLNKVERALGEKDLDKIQKRILTAKQNDWNFRVEKIIDLIKNYRNR